MSGAAGGLADDAYPEPTSETGACLLYVRRQCERLAACGRTFNPECARNEGDCPDLFFSTGSSWSVTSLVACSKAWRSFACEDLAGGELPDCVTPGSHAVGEPCAFAAQCNTLACLLPTSSSCGQCAVVVEPGQDCGAGASCPGLQVCDEPTGDCYSWIRLPPQVGETCEPELPCEAGAYCNVALFECEPTRGEGEACSAEEACHAGAELYCARHC